MKYLLILIASLIIGMLFIPSAFGYTPEAASTCADDSTGTGGNLPGMGWGDETDIKKVQQQNDSTKTYDINGRTVAETNKQIIIKKGKCQIIKQ